MPQIDSAIKYEKGDVLVSNIRPYLRKIWLADRNGGCSPDVLVFRAQADKVDPRYLYYVLSHDDFFDFMMAGKSGLKMPRGDKNAIQKYPVPVPPLAEQKKLVAVCDKINQKEEKAEKEIENLQSSIAQSFVDSGISVGQHGKSFAFASKCPKRRLGDLLVDWTGCQTKIPASDIRHEGSIPVVTQEAGSLVAGYVDNVEPISNLPLIVFGDHTCAFKYVDFPFVRGADGTQLLKFDDSVVLTQYVAHLFSAFEVLRSEKYERHMKYLKEVFIPVPTLAEQKKIVDAIRVCEKRIAVLKKQVADCRAERIAAVEKFLA